MPQPSSRRRRGSRSRSRSSDHRDGRPAERRGGRFGAAIKWLAKWTAIGGVTLAILGSIGVAWLYARVAPELPDVQTLREVQLQMPLRIYTADGELIAEYGEKRREPVMISQVPASLKNSIIAAEDARFYSHPGVDWQGLVRAVAHLVRTGRKGPGGSTITMQVARNFFLSNERTYSRKLTEIFLAFKIEHELAKDEILELYLNKIYLGQRSYGFAAAARVYYGKRIQDLTLAESAMLAGLPKAPSRYNPVVNPTRALERRDYVLRRLNELDLIDAATYRDTLALPVTASLHSAQPEAEANYVGEMARARVEQLFGDVWSTGGYNVFTSIRSADQRAANAALRGSLYDYEARHGYRGPVETLDAATLADRAATLDALDGLPRPGGLRPAAVLAVDETSAKLLALDGREHALALSDVEWARERLGVDAQGPEIERVDQVLGVGDVIMLSVDDGGGVRFVQEPGVEGALVAMDPRSGAITALVGGYDYYRSKFNRVTQARRQPGSAFKPFIYSAALAGGDTAATIYNDAPVVFHDDALEGEWRPSNYSGRFYGPTRLREALVKSRNLVSVRVLREIGIPFAREYAERFGFAAVNLPPDLSLALGSAAVTPMELTSAYAVFANGGYRVPPHFIDRIEGPRGQVVYASPRVVPCDDCGVADEGPDENPLVAEMQAETAADDRLSETNDEESGELSPEALERLEAAKLDVVDAPRVIDARNAWLMGSMMREVVQRGTARRAGEALGRADMAGKTGTTNNYLDAWFAGFNENVVASAWIGSDGLDPLGRAESGGIAALPIWTAFIAEAVAGTPDAVPAEPPGMTAVRIDRATGEPATGDGTLVEWFLDETLPEEARVTSAGGEGSGAGAGREVGAPGGDAAFDRTSREKERAVEQLF